MQLGAVNSVRFGNGYINPLLEDETYDSSKGQENFTQYIDSVKGWEKSVALRKSDNIEGQKKNFLESAASIATLVVGAFFIGRKGYNIASKVFNKALASANAFKKDNSAFVEVISKSKIGTIVKKAASVTSKQIDKLKNNAVEAANKKLSAKSIKKLDEVKQFVIKMFSKEKAPTSVGVLTSAIATPYYLNKDENKNGISDVLDRSANAYQNVEQVGKKVIEVLGVLV